MDRKTTLQKNSCLNPKTITIKRVQQEESVMQRSIQSVLALLTVGWLSQAHAQDRRVITHEDLWLMPRVGAPVISPDGKLAVISVIAPAYDPAKQAQDLWLVDVVRGGARKLTHTLAVESGVSFSNSGDTIAFSTQREGDSVPQIYTLSLQGGEAQRVAGGTQVRCGCHGGSRSIRKQGARQSQPRPRANGDECASLVARRATRSISTSAPLASPVTPTQVRAGRRPSGK